MSDWDSSVTQPPPLMGDWYRSVTQPPPLTGDWYRSVTQPPPLMSDWDRSVRQPAAAGNHRPAAKGLFAGGLTVDHHLSPLLDRRPDSPPTSPATAAEGRSTPYANINFRQSPGQSTQTQAAARRLHHCRPPMITIVNSRYRSTTASRPPSSYAISQPLPLHFRPTTNCRCRPTPDRKR